MNPEVINSVIDNLARKLAVPAAKLMEVLPNLGFRTEVEFGLLLAFLGFGLFLIILGIWATKYFKEDCMSFVIVGGIIVFLSFIMATLILPDFLLWRNYPEAWALDYILKMLK